MKLHVTGAGGTRGAGLVSYTTATRLGQGGFTGPITIIGEEFLPPYDRPALPKQTL
jgi:3-phenylpropionate/trans-cinnamate dioxygenase ferredoxin reductase component